MNSLQDCCFCFLQMCGPTSAKEIMSQYESTNEKTTLSNDVYKFTTDDVTTSSTTSTKATTILQSAVIESDVKKRRSN